MHSFSVPWCWVYVPVIGLDQEIMCVQRYLFFGRGVVSLTQRMEELGIWEENIHLKLSLPLMPPWVTYSVLWRVRRLRANWQVPGFLKKSAPVAPVYASPSILSAIWEHKPMTDDSAASFHQKYLSGHLVFPLYFYMAFKIIYS